MLRKHRIYLPQPGWPVFILKILASVSLMAIVLFSSMGEASWWLRAPWQHKVPAVSGLVLLGAGVYAACLLALGFRPRDFSRRAAE
jgi:putative peptidoglycan lipid II flippase